MTKISAHALVEQAWQVSADFTTPILGSQPSSSVAVSWVRQRSIDRKIIELKRQGVKPEEAKVQAESVVNESMGVTDEEMEGSEVPVTVFHRDSYGLYLMDFQLKGAIKEAAKQLRLKVPGQKAAEVNALRFVEGGLWVYPIHPQHGRNIYFMRDNDFVTEEDYVFDRIKRVETPQGPRTSIAASETINPPCSIQFMIVKLIGYPLTFERHVEPMLAYLSYQGIGQWRGAGHGRIECDVVELTKAEIKAMLP